MSNEDQLNTLRQKVAELRVAKRYCQDFQLVCSPQLRGPMNQFYTWLCNQEKRAINLGMQLKESDNQQSRG